MADAPADVCVTLCEIFGLLALQLLPRLVGLDGTPPALARVLIAPPGDVPLPAVVEPLVNNET